MKHIFLDIDGTIVDHSRHIIPEKTLYTIKELAKEHTIWLCTGRVYKSAKVDIGVDVDNYICALGAMILMNGKQIYDQVFTDEEVLLINQKADELGIELSYECAKHSYLKKNFYTRMSANRPQAYETSRDYWQPYSIYDGEPIYKMMMEAQDEESFKEFTEYFKDKFEFCRSTNPKIIASEVSPKNISKGKAIKRLIDMGIVNYEDTICVGDSPNDVSMFKECKMSVAMGQGYDFVKKEALYVTDSISDDGFYKAFKHLGLIK